MNMKISSVFAGLCVLAASVVCSAPARAQSSESKEKPPMYSYVSNWNIPRAQWGEMGKAGTANQKILEKAIADGSIVAYGDDEE